MTQIFPSQHCVPGPPPHDVTHLFSCAAKSLYKEPSTLVLVRIKEENIQNNSVCCLFITDTENPSDTEGISPH